MKKILALCAVAALAAAFGLWRLLRAPRVYGEFAGAPLVGVAEVLDHPDRYRQKTVALRDVVREQCTTMGCYFFFKDGERMLRVDLQEIAMTAPKRRNGRPARVEGRVVPFDHSFQFWATAVEFE